MASEINDLKMVKSLLRQGANLHVCNNMGNSPRGMAKNKGHLEILKALNLGWAYNNRPQDIIGCFVDYSECNFLPKWTAGMFRTFRKITHFPYGLRFDDIVSEAIRALSVDENENITTEQLTEFLGYLKYYANQKGVDLTQYKDGEVHRLLSWLYYMKIDFEDIAPLAPSVSFQAPVMSS